jgi:hypothetical protein
MSDNLLAIVKEIMSSPVPEKESLKNPFKNSSRKRVNPDDKRLNFNEIPSNVEEWTARTFVDYFGVKYFETFKSNYRKVYGNDGKLFKDIMRFMASNGLDKNHHTKKFVDWCFDNKDEVLKYNSHFAVLSILKMINYYFQEEVLPLVEKDEIDRSHYEENILDEIKEADSEGKASEIFVRFGIPIAASYFIIYKGISEESIIKGLCSYIEKLKTGGLESEPRIKQIFERSIIRSPYNSNFALLDWRTRFNQYCNKYKSEKWWRDEDYKGNPLNEYSRLINKTHN